MFDPVTCFKKLFHVECLPHQRVDILSLVDSLDFPPLAEKLRAMRESAARKGKLTYIMAFRRPGCGECMILEKRFVNLLYNEHNISISPWVAFAGHVLVRSRSFYEAVEPKLLALLPDTMPQGVDRRA